MPAMAPLPRKRVTQSPPFTYTGLDYFGPLFIKETSGTKKVWICLYTCLAVRAIHLELIKDMSAEQFLLCLRRFIARRGTPEQIISDNAPQFKLAKSVLDKVWMNVIMDRGVRKYMSDQGIKWQFIVELAPWMGGFYERLVGCVKKCLRKAIGKACLTYDQLHTLMIEAEAVVNTRPLVYVDDDINSSITLTPADFLTLNPKTGMPDAEPDSDDPDLEYKPRISSAEKLLQTWKKGQRLLNGFWNRWRDSYILNLRERSQRHLSAPRIQAPSQPKTGDVVIVKDNYYVDHGTWGKFMI
ncbi:uncharacterized protein [Ptychodera flava]|uniref:uncharacterized protein n=1 Tax=Ptychodera flava TaxID=63121 RepID=UPI00396A7F96